MPLVSPTLAGNPRLTRRAEVSLGIVCPIANEGEDAPRFTKAALAQCTGFKKVQFFAISDRATKDNSLDLMKALAASEPRLQVVWAPEDRWPVDAYIRGYRDTSPPGASVLPRKNVVHGELGGSKRDLVKEPVTACR